MVGVFCIILNTFSCEDRTFMILQMQRTINTLFEQITIANANKFGRKSENSMFLKDR